MQIRNRFEVPMPPADAWAFLMNIPSTVTCFPGAELVETMDENNHKGRVTVRLGPLTMIFNGKLRIEDRDEAVHSATVKATWTESKGRGNAITVTRFALHAEGEGTAVKMDTDVQLAGQIAQYGRGAGMISDVSAQLVSKFADNLRASIDANAGLSGDAARDRPHTEISGVRLAGRALLNRVKRGSD